MLSSNEPFKTPEVANPFPRKFKIRPLQIKLGHRVKTGQYQQSGDLHP